MQIIDGKAVSKAVKEQVKQRCEELKAQGITPGLAVIIVGDDSASQVYVRNKERACEECGFYSVKYALPAATTQQELNSLVEKLNNDPKINGILCQLPLPEHLDDKEVINRIDPIKDVDAFHPVNVGAIMIGDYNFLPCTPAGVMELIHSTGVEISGKKAVVMDRDENGKLCGDVDFENVKDKCSFITPVPGGVGPMTIAMLMRNTLTAAEIQNGIK